MLEHSGEKGDLARGGANLVGGYAARVEEPGDPVRFPGNESKRLNRQHFRSIACNLGVPLHPVPFAFP